MYNSILEIIQTLTKNILPKFCIGGTITLKYSMDLNSLKHWAIAINSLKSIDLLQIKFHTQTTDRWSCSSKKYHSDYGWKG